MSYSRKQVQVLDLLYMHILFKYFRHHFANIQSKKPIQTQYLYSSFPRKVRVCVRVNNSKTTSPRDMLSFLKDTLSIEDEKCSRHANLSFYSKIPLPFPNSSYLLEPSNPMANAEMRFLRLYNNLNQAIGLQLSVLPPIRSHNHIVYFIYFCWPSTVWTSLEIRTSFVRVLFIF